MRSEEIESTVKQLMAFGEHIQELLANCKWRASGTASEDNVGSWLVAMAPVSAREYVSSSVTSPRSQAAAGDVAGSIPNACSLGYWRRIGT
jgi:hypothetical protein